MPLRYKIEYRLEDKLSDFHFAHKKQRQSKARLQDKEQTASRSPKETEKKRTGKGGTKTRKDGKTATGLEKVVLPAGYCIYYARDHGGSLLPADMGTQPGKLPRPIQKGLGVVDPGSQHNVLEEEYAIIREVVEMLLERQESNGVERDKYRVGGQSQHRTELLEQLFLPLAQDTEDVTETDLVHNEGQLLHCETDSPDIDTSRSSPRTARNSSRCLLPISKALQATLSPRGPFLVAGQSFKDLTRDVDSKEEDGSTVVLVEMPAEYRELTEENEVESEALVISGIKTRCQKAKGLYSDSQQMYSQGHADRDPCVIKKRPSFPVLSPSPRNDGPLHVVSERFKMDVRNKNNRISQKNTGIIDGETPFKVRPPTPAFRDHQVKAAGRELKQTSPLENQQHQAAAIGTFKMSQTPSTVTSKVSDTPSTTTFKLSKKQTEGRISVTKMPSKVILKVVLPREDKSREGRLLSRQRPPSQALTSCTFPPPVPSSLSVLSDADVCDDGSRDRVLLQDGAEADDEDSVGIQSRADSARSARFKQSPAAQSASFKTNKVKFMDIDKNSSSTSSTHAERSARSEQHHHETLSTAFSSTVLRSGAISPKTTQQLSCQRATRCDVLGPDLCADCEARQHRNQFSTQQELLYPQISVNPRHMVAPQKLQDGHVAERGAQNAHGPASHWPHISLGQLNNVITDLDLCKRIAQKDRRAKLRSTFS